MTQGSWNAVAQSNKLTKSIYEHLKVQDGATINLTNKYGDVIVNTWDTDSVLIEVEITAYGKNDESLDKTMSRVYVDFNNFDDLVNISTVMDLNSSFGVEMWFSKNVASKNKVRIDYEITIPESASLFLNNKYGNVFIGDLITKAEIKVAHGDLRIQSLKGSSKINLSFGKGHVKQLDATSLYLNNAKLDIENAGDMRVESSASVIDIAFVQSLWLNSRNDKLKVKKVRSISGRTSFSDISVDSMMDRVDLILNYGDFKVNSINSNFSRVMLIGKSTGIDISFDMGSYFSASITGLEEKMFLTRNFIGMQKTRNEEDDTIISLNGSVGAFKPKQSNVVVTNDRGETILYLEETGGITNKK
jgi:hypothetical protein